MKMENQEMPAGVEEGAAAAAVCRIGSVLDIQRETFEYLHI